MLLRFHVYIAILQTPRHHSPPAYTQRHPARLTRIPSVPIVLMRVQRSRKQHLVQSFYTFIAQEAPCVGLLYQHLPIGNTLCHMLGLSSPQVCMWLLTPLDLITVIVFPAALVMRLQNWTLMYTAPPKVVLSEAVDREGGRAACTAK